MAGRPDPAILCVGRLYCDLIFTDVPRLPSMGTEVFAGGVGLHAGGGAFITAAWLASLGHRVELASQIPAAPFHGLVVAELKRARLGLGLCRAPDPGFDPQLTVAIAGQGDRAFLTRRAGPAAPDLTAEDLRRSGIRHIHVGELSTLARTTGPRAARAGGRCDDLARLRLGRGHGAGTRVAPAGRGRCLPSERRRGAPPPSSAEWPSPSRRSRSSRRARRARPPIHGRPRDSPNRPSVSVRWTPPGAGDAFNAGFPGAWLAGEPLALLPSRRQRHGGEGDRGPGRVSRRC
jgi:hypothetical protein